jgi:hypothetical protein
LQERPAHQLVDGVVAADVFAQDDQLSAGVEQDLRAALAAQP